MAVAMVTQKKINTFCPSNLQKFIKVKWFGISISLGSPMKFFSTLHEVPSYIANASGYDYHFARHCGTFCGLKWRIWLAKMYFSLLKYTK